MLVHWDEKEFDPFVEASIETAEEIPIVAKINASFIDEETADQLRVGGTWSYTLGDLHNAVQLGITLHGLPEWLIIK